MSILDIDEDEMEFLRNKDRAERRKKNRFISDFETPDDEDDDGDDDSHSEPVLIYVNSITGDGS
jgi:hypothetical protein